METIDFKKIHKELYCAKQTPEELTVPQGTFLAVDGKGKPGGKGYQQAIEQLYSVAYTIKFTLKGARVLDFKVPNLECLWFDDPKTTSSSEWKWRLLIRIPDEVTDTHLGDAQRQVQEKKGIEASAVQRITWTEGRAIQVLHVGPYEEVTGTYERLWAFGEKCGLVAQETGHEIYLNDPRRTSPERLKTIVRMPVPPG